MRTKLWCMAIVAMLGIQASFGANLLVNSDFSSSTIANESTPEFQDLDGGWLTPGTTSWTLPGDGNALAGNIEKGLAQIVSLNSTGTGFDFSFDWTPDSASGATELELAYYLVGWKLNDGASPSNTDDFFNNMNNTSLSTREMIGALGGKATAVDLITGLEYTTNYPVADAQVAGGTAGTTLNVSHSSLTYTVDDFDYIGVLFHNNNEAKAGSTISNLNLSVIGGTTPSLPPSFKEEPTVKSGTFVQLDYTDTLADDVSEPNDDVVTFTKLTGADWLSVATNGVLTGTAMTNDLGLNVFTVEVSDVDGSATGTVHISVGDVQPEAAEGEMVVNWTMADPDFAEDNQFVAWRNVDAGWVADKTVDVWSLTDTPGEMKMVSGSSNDIEDGLAQIFSVQGYGDSLTFKFDWTAGANASNGTENLLYEVIGWKTTNPSPASQGFRSIQLNTTVIDDFAGNAIWTDLLDGMSGTGQTNATQGTFVGTPGVVTSANITIDLSAFGADVSDFDVMGIRFHIATNSLSGIGGVIDNVSLLSEIPPAATVVQWGISGGDTNIVAADALEDILDTPTTYVAGTDVTAELEAAYTNASGEALYYTDRTDRTPGFNMAYYATDPLTSNHEITDETPGDQIAFGRNTTNIQLMVVWEAADFLVPAEELKTLAIETERTGTTGTNEYRYLIQQGSQFYVSASNTLLAAHSSDGDVEVDSLDWYAFTAFSNDAGTIAGTATPIASFTNINAVGYYVNLENASTATMSSRTRYFKAAATQAAASGFDGFLEQYTELSGVETDDYDEDGLSDWGEYVFGGIPTDDTDIGTQPAFDSANGEYLFSIIDDSTLKYYVLTNLDLVIGEWGTNIGPVDITVDSDSLGSYSNNVGTANDALFLKLLVE
ncbi:hypothetical protein [Pontiella sulfatireligans]|uniref:Dystroglycan-type cadherin-like domain-containing protein n=1 Tax=Pontiella sulfatireligans TaxID=2750658 RepID=A0A6C2UF37_9BACT|nr:hypothetical protein [Pontiella sulfatireligans]VGO18493.1 hypothetical protein SCARR_00546 [Pontiella sulfatireligans]